MAKTDIKRIRFFYFDRSFHFPERNQLKANLVSLFQSEGLKLNTVNYNFCSDPYLFKLNITHLNHKTFTDIITFQYSTATNPILAEIYISVDRVKENALSYNTSFLNELYRVIIHGALHLCGYGDKTSKETLLMRKKENFYLKRFVPRGTRSKRSF
jgi:probable rRNA maturation factor